MKKTILFAIEGLDWKTLNRLVDEGRLPCFQSLFDSGTSGSVRSQHPILATAMWETIITGKMAYEHGNTSFLKIDAIGAKTRLGTQRAQKYTKNIFELVDDSGYDSTLVGWPLSHNTKLKSGIQVPARFIKSKVLHKTDSSFGWPYPNDEKFKLSEELLESVAKLRVHPQEISVEEIGQFIGTDASAYTDEQVFILKKIFSNFLSVYAISTFLIQETSTPMFSIYVDFIDSIQFQFDHSRLFLSVSDRDQIIDQCYVLLDKAISRTLNSANFEYKIVLSECGSTHRKLRLNRSSSETKLHSSDLVNGVAMFSGPDIAQDASLGTYDSRKIFNSLLQFLQIKQVETTDFDRGDTQYVKDLISSMDVSDQKNVRVNRINSAYWCAQNLLEHSLYDKAKELLEKALKIDDKNVLVIKLLQYVYQKKNIPLPPNLHGADQHTTDLNSLIIKAKTALKSKQRDKGLDYLIQAEVKADNVPKFLHTIYNLYWQAKDLSAAQRVVMKILEIDQDDHTAWNKKARIESKEGAIAEALDSLNTSVQIRNHQPMVYYQLAMLSIQNNKKEDAKRFLDYAILQNPSNRNFRLVALRFQDFIGLTEGERAEHLELFESGIVGEVNIISSFDTVMITDAIEQCQDKQIKDSWTEAMELFKKSVQKGAPLLGKSRDNYVLLPKHLMQMPIELRYNVHIVVPEKDAFIGRSSRLKSQNEQKVNPSKMWEKRGEMIQALIDDSLSSMPHISIKQYREIELVELLKTTAKL